MTGRAAARLAWSLLAAWALITALTLGLMVWSLSVELPPEFGTRAAEFVDAITFLAFPFVGALIAARRPANPIGWIFLVASLLVALGSLFGEYALRGLVASPGSLPGAAFAAWTYQWIWIWQVALLPPLFLLFPTGRLTNRRWRWALLPGAFAGLLVSGPVAIASWEFRGRALLLDPDSIDGLNNAEYLIFVALGLAGLGLLASVVSLLLRWRRSSGKERQQVKWLVAAGAVVILDLIGNSFFEFQGLLRQLLSIAAFLTVPAAVGIAILRYRLYDIDRLISRTLSYAALTAILVGIYLAGVLGTQSVLPVADDSPVAVAVSTLVMVALFKPLRERIQGLVDRRFYRRRYDAERTVETFGSRLRRQVDLEAVSAELVTVTRETMQPAHVSLWLRGSESRPAEAQVPR